MSHRNRRLAVAALLASAPAARACGPFFPNQVIVNGDAGLLAMPTGDFATEVAALCPPGPPPFRAIPPQADKPDSNPTGYDQSVAIDLADLEAALTAAGVPAERRAAILTPYRQLREQLASHLRALADPQSPAPGPPYTALPSGLPDEFADYLRGLLAYDGQDFTTARRIWTALLDRPADQRHWRSTWAAYMIGRSYVTTDRNKAAAAFARTRELATAGFADSLGLASASLGWEAKAELLSGRPNAAIALYVKQDWTGDRSAAMSLRDAAHAVFTGGPAALAVAARHELSCRVISIYVLSNGGPFSHLSPYETDLVPAWLAAVRAAAATNVPGADRLAWAAYRSGDFSAAGDWAARAPAGSPIAQWVRAKLLMRDGKVDAAAAVLADVVHAFPTNLSKAGALLADVDVRPAEHVGRLVGGDLAILRLSRGQYIDSLDLLLRTGHWLDAAYVAERVLTIDELRAYVDHHVPTGATTRPSSSMASGFDDPSPPDREATDLRCLLARRLARSDKWSDARPYFTPDLQKTSDDYTRALRDGADGKRPAADRAASLVIAARLARAQGMELLGTELDPDYHAFEGQFQFEGASRPRGGKDTLSTPTADELSRWKGSALTDPHRWHYRYVAADLAWSAALLMPDGSTDTAAVLYEAGCWLKDRDAKGAERFYKALTKRCPATALGQQAAALHWFPKPPAPH